MAFCLAYWSEAAGLGFLKADYMWEHCIGSALLAWPVGMSSLITWSYIQTHWVSSSLGGFT